MIKWPQRKPGTREGEEESPDLKTPEQIEEERIEAEKYKGKLDKAAAEIKKKSSVKNKIITSVLFGVNIAVVVLILWWQISSETVVGIENLYFNAGFFILLLFVFALVMFFETLPITILIKKETGRIRWGLSYKTAVIGRYYDSVTPLATGGQAFQIFYLKSRGVPAATALSIPMSKYIFMQFMWQLLATIILLSTNIGSSAGEVAVLIGAIIGFILNFALVAFVTVVSLSKQLGEKMVGGIVGLLKKMRFVKDYDKTYSKIMGFVADYQNVMKAVKDEFYYLLGLSVISLVNLVLKYSIPFFVFMVFNGGGTFSDFATIFSISILIDLAASFVPLPGGTGVSEISFAALFATVFASGTLFWALLFWRFMTYYIYIIQGLGVIIYDYAYGNKRYLWRKKSWQLQCESKEFKQIQIQKFRDEREKRRRK